MGISYTDNYSQQTAQYKQEEANWKLNFSDLFENQKRLELKCWEGGTYSYSAPKHDLQPKSTGLRSVFSKFALNLAFKEIEVGKNNDLSIKQILFAKNKRGGLLRPTDVQSEPYLSCKIIWIILISIKQSSPISHFGKNNGGKDNVAHNPC